MALSDSLEHKNFVKFKETIVLLSYLVKEAEK